MYLTPQERQSLRIASADGDDAINQLVARINQANPQAFHTKVTLAARVFYHEPATRLPGSGFVDSIASGRTAQALAEQRELDTASREKEVL